MELVVQANLGSRAATAGVSRCTVGPAGVSPTVYQRAKGDPDKRPFGTQQNLNAIGYE